MSAIKSSARLEYICIFHMFICVLGSFLDPTSYFVGLMIVGWSCVHCRYFLAFSFWWFMGLLFNCHSVFLCGIWSLTNSNATWHLITHELMGFGRQSSWNRDDTVCDCYRYTPMIYWLVLVEFRWQKFVEFRWCSSWLPRIHSIGFYWWNLDDRSSWNSDDAVRDCYRYTHDLWASIVMVIWKHR